LTGVWAGEHPKEIWYPLRIFATVEASNFKFCTQNEFGTSLPKTAFWTKIGGGLGHGSIQKKFGTRYVFLQPLKPATSNLVHNLALRLAYQKQRFGPKLAWVWAKGASQKIGTPYLFLQPLKLATSNLVHNLRLGRAYQKTTFWTKIGGVWPREHPKKVGTPYLFLQPLKLATEKLVHNMISGLPSQTQALGRV